MLSASTHTHALAHTNIHCTIYLLWRKIAQSRKHVGSIVLEREEYTEVRLNKFGEEGEGHSVQRQKMEKTHSRNQQWKVWDR